MLNNKDFLHELLLTPSVSGHEEIIQQKTMEYTSAFCDRQEVDATGNVLHRVNPDHPFQVLLMGHIDEIGFLVSHIDGSGMIKVVRNGGVRVPLYVGSPVQIVHEGRKVPGVVCVVSSQVGNKDLKAQDLYIDIGASSKEEAARYAAIGDPVCADTCVRELLNDNFSARALDDRIGAFIVMEALRVAKEKGVQIGAVAATTVGEETSGRGAYWASTKVRPALAIAVDVTYVSDTPGTVPEDTGEVSLGKGPVLCTATMVNKKANSLLMQIAEEKGIKVQWEVATGHTGTDADTVHRTLEGVPVALVSIPNRYMHSSVEVCNYKDVEECITLLSELLLQITPDFDFTNLQPVCLE